MEQAAKILGPATLFWYDPEADKVCKQNSEKVSELIPTVERLNRQGWSWYIYEFKRETK